MAGHSSSVGTSIAKFITTGVVGFMATICDWFSVTPDALKRPGCRPNSPPPGGGLSSLG